MLLSAQSCLGGFYDSGQSLPEAHAKPCSQHQLQKRSSVAGRNCCPQKLRGRRHRIASVSHRGCASQRISATRTRIARIFASHRIAISVFSTHHHSHRIAAPIAGYGPLSSQRQLPRCGFYVFFVCHARA